MNVYKDSKKEVEQWISDPLSRAVWAYGNGEIAVLGNDFRRVEIPSPKIVVNLPWT